MSRLLDKAKQAAAGTKALTAEAEATLDKLLADQANATGKRAAAAAPHESLIEEAQQGAAELNAATAQLTNE